MATRKLTVEIVGDPSSASRAFKKLGDDSARLEGRLKKVGGGAGRAFMGIGKAATAAGAAIGAGIVYESVRAVKAFEETRKVGAQTNAVLKSTGGVARVSAAQVADLATAISRKTGVDDEAIQSGENLLLTFTKIRNETGKGNDVFTQATKVATDMSVALGQDMKSSAIQVGKALNDPVKGVTALQRVGVSFTAQQKEQIAALVESGKTLEAQKFILRELRTEFGGSAAAQATALDKAKVAAGNLEETLGSGLAPAVDAVANEFTQLALKVEPELNRVTRGINRTFERDDIDLADKFRISWAKIRRRLDPVIRDVEREVGRLELGDKLARAFEKAAPALADAAARSAPRVAGAFVTAFREAGPWGKLITVAFLASKMGAFSTVGRLAADGFTRSYRRRVGGAMPDVAQANAGTYTGAFATQAGTNIGAVSGKGGRLRNAFTKAGRGLGGAMGIAAAGLFAVELAKGVQDTLGDLVPSGKGKSQFGNPDAGGWNLWNVVKDAVGDGAGKVAKGVTGGLPQGGAFGGDLMGARSAMRPFAAMGARFGLGVTSGRRPGSITSSGNVSWHSTGEAIDMSGPPAGMLRYAKALRSRFGGRLSELIYTPMGAGIKDGRPHTYTGKVAADHLDHVHVAFDSGRRGIGDGLGRFDATSYGPPWNAMNGTGVTATGVNLKSGQRRYGVAVDPSVIPLGTMLKITPNPFGYSGLFEAFDTGGAIKGNRIDFYDWRGRAAQNRWGYRSVAVSTEGGGRAGRGASRLTPRQAGARESFRAFSRSQTRAAAGAERAAGLTGPGFGGTYDQQLANVGVETAAARAGDNLPALIKALQRELRIKKRRLKRVKRALKKRIRRDTRQRLTEEHGQLIGEIAELAATLKEYQADQRGGATTITQAESMEAGVAEAGEGGPTPADFANAAIAEASITPGLDDDIAATSALERVLWGDVEAARASGDPRRVAEAISAWKGVKDSLDQLRGTLEETANRNAEAQRELAAEMKRYTDFATSIQGVSQREMTKYLADVWSGQVIGRDLRGRMSTAGNGQKVRLP